MTGRQVKERSEIARQRFRFAPVRAGDEAAPSEAPAAPPPPAVLRRCAQRSSTTRFAAASGSPGSPAPRSDRGVLSVSWKSRQFSVYLLIDGTTRRVSGED